MPIRAKSGNAPANFAKFLNNVIDSKVNGFISMFTQIGNHAMTEMREKRRYRYTDQTGNLRSSTGFAVIYNGRVVAGNVFEQVKNGAEGVKEGKNIVKEVSKDMGSNEIALVLVAGMNYAYYVERMGLNVTDSAVYLATREFDSMMEKLGLK